MEKLVAPSMLSADFLHLEKDVERVNAEGDIFHLDIMDGVFVPNLSYGFPVVQAIARKATRPMDVHLMIVHPEKYIPRFADTGASMISFHLEAAEDDGNDPAEILRLIRSRGIQAGLAIDPDVPVEKLFPYLEEADFVLVMSVFAGFGGQSFIEASYERIAAVRREISRRGLNVRIEVDGGVSAANAGRLAAAGADILVAGSSVFKSEDPAEAIRQIRSNALNQIM
ncbi:MAG: ribulose-phosphate 3-epimerase [Bacteroidales bacterium]|nr:ribulose-phosphate 3-epimerase [Bacteroidales bacterium]